MSDEAMEKRKAARNWREYLEEQKEVFRIYSWVWRELINDKGRRHIKYALVALGIGMAFVMAMPWLVSFIFDGLVERDSSLVLWGLGGFAVCMLIKRFFMWLFDRSREYAQGEQVKHMDVRLSELFFGKSLGQHMQDGGILNAANIEKGRSRVWHIQSMLLFQGVPALVEILAAYIFLWFISPVIGLVMTVLAINYTIWMFFLNCRTMRTCISIDADFRRLNRHRVERWDNVERVKTCGKEHEEAAYMADWFGRVIRDDRKFWLWFINMISLRGLTNSLATFIVFGYGAWLVWQGSWTVGLLYPAYRWTQSVTENLWRMSQIEHQLNWNMPSIRSMMQALTTEPDIADPPEAKLLPKNEPLRIEIDSVTHGYPVTKPHEDGEDDAEDAAQSSLPVLREVSFSIEPGEKVALVGSSGAGKTTIMRLLQRYTDPSEGGIKVNGLDLRNIALDSWRQQLGYVPQQAQVLDGTIRYNLLYGLPKEEREKVSDEELWEIMRTLQIDFGDRLTHGLDTMVGRRGIKLSGGEAQRLMVGAATLRHPRLMIIDEATSSLDSTTEKLVQKGLEVTLDDETSALIIAHRLSTVRKLCTKFVVLKSSDELHNGDAQVEAIGSSFEELWEISPTFRRLAEDQDITVST